MLREVGDGPLPRVVLARSLPGGSPYTVSVYRLADTLIDSGPPATAGDLAAWAASHGVRRVAHTHHHEDHVGGSPLLAARGVEILAGPETAAMLAHPYRRPLFRRLLWGQPAAVAARELPPVLRGEGYELQALPTPGHSHDHVTFWEPTRRWAFTGDLFVASRHSYLRRVENAWLILQALERLLALGVETAFCAHAGPVPEPRAALGAKVRRWRELAAAAEDLWQRGWRLSAIRRHLLGREGALTRLSAGELSKTNLVASLLFHRPIDAAGSAGSPRSP